MSAYRQHTCKPLVQTKLKCGGFFIAGCGGEAGMKYTKPALSFEQQADQLLSRGSRPTVRG